MICATTHHIKAIESERLSYLHDRYIHIFKVCTVINYSKTLVIERCLIEEIGSGTRSLI